MVSKSNHSTECLFVEEAFCISDNYLDQFLSTLLEHHMEPPFNLQKFGEKLLARLLALLVLILSLAHIWRFHILEGDFKEINFDPRPLGFNHPLPTCTFKSLLLKSRIH